MNLDCSIFIYKIVYYIINQGVIVDPVSKFYFINSYGGKISYTYHGLVYDYDPSVTFDGWILNLQSTPKDELIKNRKLVISNRQPISYYGEEKPCVGISYTEKIHEFANQNAADRFVLDITNDIKYTDGATRPPFLFSFNCYRKPDDIDSGTTLKEVFLNVDPLIISTTSAIPGQQSGFGFRTIAVIQHSLLIKVFMQVMHHRLIFQE